MRTNVHDEPLSAEELATVEASAIGQRFVIVKAANRVWFADGKWNTKLMIKLGGRREPSA